MPTIKPNRRALLAQIRRTDQRIIGIYERAAEELARKAGTAKAESLTERWLTDYQHALRDVIGDMRSSLTGTIRDGATAAAQLPVGATADWLAEAARRTGMDESFRGVLSGAPTGPLRAMLQGRMYSDGRSLSDRVWTATGRLQGGIEEVVAQGIAQKRSAFQVAKDLEAFVDPMQAEPFEWNKVYPKIPFPLIVEYNAQRLARTSINHAYWGANKAAAELNPLCLGMQWLLSPSHLARQVLPYGPDICDVYAEHNEGLGVGVYPIAKLPMPHPQCLCTQAQVVPSMDAAVDRLNRWLDGGQDPALTKGFGAWRKDAGADRKVTARFAGQAGGSDKGASEIGAEVRASITQTVDKMAQDFGFLADSKGRFELADIGADIARCTIGLQPGGGYTRKVLLNPSVWGDMQSLRNTLADLVANGYHVDTQSAESLAAHELGHAVMHELALRRAEQRPELAILMSTPQGFWEAMHTANGELVQEAYSAAFTDESYEEIMEAIKRELGTKAQTESGEFPAQCFASYYSGDHTSQIAKKVVQYYQRLYREART